MRISDRTRSGFLFISGSVYRRVPIFKYEKPCEIFLQTHDAYRLKYGFQVHAFVVMPDHYHLLLWFPQEGRLADFLRDFKSLVVRQILAWMREKHLSRLLGCFRLRTAPQRFRDARYCVLQYRHVVKRFEGGKAVWQKVNYIHENPVREGLIAKAEEYPYSSLQAYLRKSSSCVKVDVLE